MCSPTEARQKWGAQGDRTKRKVEGRSRSSSVVKALLYDMSVVGRAGTRVCHMHAMQLPGRHGLQSVPKTFKALLDNLEQTELSLSLKFPATLPLQEEAGTDSSLCCCYNNL